MKPYFTLFPNKKQHHKPRWQKKYNTSKRVALQIEDAWLQL